MAYKFEEKLKEIIVSCKESVSMDQINEETDLVRDFAFDSISFIQLVVQLESEFNFEIDDEYLSGEKLSPYKSLIEMLKTQIEGEQ